RAALECFAAGSLWLLSSRAVFHPASSTFAATNSASYDSEGRIMIGLNHVSKVYGAKSGVAGDVIRALDDFTLRVEPGEWIAVMGPSGSGKSTLVNLIGCLDRPTSGEIWLEGANVAELGNQELNRVRAEKIGFVFQQFHLIPYLSAVENVMLAQYFHSMTDEAEARQELERVGLKDSADHLPSQIS